MKDKLRNGIALSLIPQLLLVVWLGGRPDVVEAYYSQGIYPVISTFFRTMFGWIPFSVGEILYLLLILLAVRYVILKRMHIRKQPWLFVRNVVLVLSVFYFTFNLGWAINYYRMPLAEKFGIRDSAQSSEVIELTEKLILNTNRLQLEIMEDSTQMVKVPYDRDAIYDKTISAYRQLREQFPFLAYPQASLKNSNSGALMGYLGIGGYLNPFTNEAQVNGLTPVFRLPVVTAHEIGHQVGYAKENETNFIGYLVTSKNEDIYFRYSASAYALSYCLSAVRRTNKDTYEHLSEKINAGVWENYLELSEFNQKYANPFEPVFKTMFSTFLKANQQKDGIKSYGKVVELMVGYHEKYPL